jgi:uncharacterized protein YbbC (DUF1343 family)
MTIGELAQLFNDRFNTRKTNLTVIPMMGWKRKMWFDQTGLSWVPPSPNMPSLQTANVYPGQVLLEGTNISEGRGTTRPFEIFGAPWIDEQDFVQKLNDLSLSGVMFREARFTPRFSKFKNQSCAGAQINVLDREIYRPFSATLHIIQVAARMYPEKVQFHARYFDCIIGSSSVRQAIEKDSPVDKIIRTFSSQIQEFFDQRKACLLYEVPNES